MQQNIIMTLLLFVLTLLLLLIFLGRIASMQCIRCGILLQMSMCLSVWVCVYVSSRRVSCAKAGEIPFRGLTHVGPRNHVLNRGEDRTNPFTAARGEKSAMRPFAKLLWTLIFIIIIIVTLGGRSLYLCMLLFFIFKAHAQTCQRISLKHFHMMWL